MRRACLVLALLGCSQNDKPPAPTQVVEPTVAPKPVIPEPKPGVSQRLFADDATYDTLPLSIAVETMGGISTILIPRGTKLPASITEAFSTAQDNQASVEIHVVQGERAMAKDNRTLARFQLHGIPPAPRGVPVIDVTFAIVDHGVLEVSAHDRATGEQRDIRIDGAASALDQATIDKLLADAAAARSEDDRTRTWHETYGKLQGLTYEARRLLASVGDKLSPAMKKRWTDEVARAEVLLASSTMPGDPALLVKAVGALQQTMHAGSEDLYRNAK